MKFSPFWLLCTLWFALIAVAYVAAVGVGEQPVGGHQFRSHRPEVLILGERHRHREDGVLLTVMIREMSKQRPPPVLVLELFSASQQPQIDEFLLGQISLKSLFANCGLSADDRRHYGELLVCARDSEMPVVAADIDLPEDSYAPTAAEPAVFASEYESHFRLVFEQAHEAGEDAVVSRAWRIHRMRDTALADATLAAWRVHMGSTCILVAGRFHVLAGGVPTIICARDGGVRVEVVDLASADTATTAGDFAHLRQSSKNAPEGRHE